MNHVKKSGFFLKNRLAKIMAGPRIRVAVPRKLHNTERSKGTGDNKATIVPNSNVDILNTYYIMRSYFSKVSCKCFQMNYKIILASYILTKTYCI